MLGLAAVLGGCPTTSHRYDTARVSDLARLKVRGAERGSDPEVAELLARPLDVEAAVRVALFQNRDLRADLLELGVAAGDRLQAGLPANPDFEVEVLPERDARLELRVEQEITSLVLAPIAGEIADDEVEAARLDVATSAIQLSYRVRLAFHALQAAEERLALVRASNDNLAVARDAAETLRTTGNLSELDAAGHRLAFDRGAAILVEHEPAVATARERLARLLGVDGSDPWRVAAPLPPVRQADPQLADVEGRAVSASLEMMALERRGRAASRRATLTDVRGWLPRTTVDVHALDVRPEEPGGDGGWRFGGGVGLEVPIFDRGQGRATAHRSRRDGLSARREGLALELRSLAREFAQRVRDTHRVARRYDDHLVPRQRALTAETLRQYNAMQLDAFALLSVHRAQLDTELSAVDARRAYHDAVAGLRALWRGARVSAAPTSSSPEIETDEENGDH